MCLKIAVSRVSAVLGRHKFCGAKAARASFLQLRYPFLAPPVLESKTRALKRAASGRQRIENMLIGSRFENKAVATYEKLTQKTISERGKKCIGKFSTAAGTSYKINGKIDGFDGECIVEIKTRTSNFFSVATHDLDQLCLYCVLMKRPGKIVQFANDSCDFGKVHTYNAMQSRFKTDLKPHLDDFFDDLANLLPNEKKTQ